MISAASGTGVGDGAGVWVGVRVTVRVGVGEGVWVRVDVTVGVRVRAAVAVNVAVAVGCGVGVGGMGVGSLPQAAATNATQRASHCHHLWFFRFASIGLVTTGLPPNAPAFSLAAHTGADYSTASRGTRTASGRPVWHEPLDTG